ncbi:hypothetical protein [Tautonia plasticadhaerens]|uniref:GYF domain-containing protein n=1 Tax=Tautonia plasticadhaerens TaxID=2527974 RepID=A0A518GWP8_9BACT|nr:hypothetical protein [Tautonia plasticadhaerens]QDV32981.1 hypothetical protein ElP_08230 [Tautonia plasticadhaerens]
MAVEWFILERKGIIDPLSASQMRDAAKYGRLTPGTKVRMGESGEWFAAKRIKGLFENANAPDCSSIPTEITPVPIEIASTEYSSRAFMTFVYSLPILAGIISVGFLHVYYRSKENERARQANETANEAVATAQAWLHGEGNLSDSEVEQLLTASLGDEDLRDKSSVKAELVSIQKRRADDEADNTLREANKALDEGQLQTASDILERYLSQANGTMRGDAELLKRDIELATSQDVALTLLLGLDDSSFEIFRNEFNWSFGDAEITHPVLRNRWVETLLQALPDAEKEREQIRKTNEARLIAAEERRAREAEQSKFDVLRSELAVFLGGTISGDDAALWRSPVVFKEVERQEPISVFDEKEEWESQFQVDHIRLTDGVHMSLTVKNISSFMGTSWSWLVFAVDPSKGYPPDCSLHFSIDGKIEMNFLEEVINTQSVSHAYSFPSGKRKQAFSPLFRRIANGNEIRYKLTLGSKSVEAELPGEAHEAIKKLVNAAKYEDRYILIYGR